MGKHATSRSIEVLHSQREGGHLPVDALFFQMAGSIDTVAAS